MNRLQHANHSKSRVLEFSTAIISTKVLRLAPEPASSTNEADAQQSTPPPATLNFAGSIIARSRSAQQEKKSKTNRSNLPISLRCPQKDGRRPAKARGAEAAEAAHSESTPQGQEPGTGFPIVSHRDQIAPILPPASAKHAQCSTARTSRLSKHHNGTHSPRRRPQRARRARRAQSMRSGWTKMASLCLLSESQGYCDRVRDRQLFDQRVACRPLEMYRTTAKLQALGQIRQETRRRSRH